MPDILISFVIFVLVVVALYYVAGLLPDAKLQQIARVLVFLGALIWLIKHIRPILNAF